MKKTVATLVLMAACCLGLQSAYALPKPFKTCPDCGGMGRVESWSGGYESCRKCGGDGEVCNWLGIAVLAFLAFAVWGGTKGGKKG
jgi:RNA polymerase subunit RPABC4/transcription elongation factor Spt4